MSKPTHVERASPAAPSEYEVHPFLAERVVRVAQVSSQSLPFREARHLQARDRRSGLMRDILQQCHPLLTHALDGRRRKSRSVVVEHGVELVAFGYALEVEAEEVKAAQSSS